MEDAAAAALSSEIRSESVCGGSDANGNTASYLVGADLRAQRELKPASKLKRVILNSQLVAREKPSAAGFPATTASIADGHYTSS